VFLVDLRKNILSPKFLFSSVLFTLLCLLADAPSVTAREPFSVLDEIVKNRKAVWISKGDAFSAVNVFLGFDNSLWYIVVLPVIAAFPIVYNFSDEWFSDSYIMSLSRCGYKKYILSKLAAAFFTGVAAVLLGILMFGIVVFNVFPSAEEAGGGSIDYKFIVSKVVNNAVVCGFYALLSVFFCLLLRDKFLTLSIFLVINYFSMKLDTRYYNSTDMSIEKNRVKRIFFPDCQTQLYDLIPNNMHISFYWYLPAISALSFLICGLCFFMVKRRYKNAT